MARASGCTFIYAAHSRRCMPLESSWWLLTCRYLNEIPSVAMMLIIPLSRSNLEERLRWVDPGAGERSSNIFEQ